MYKLQKIGRYCRMRCSDAHLSWANVGVGWDLMLTAVEEALREKLDQELQRRSVSDRLMQEN